MSDDKCPTCNGKDPDCPWEEEPKPEAARDKEFFLEIIESWTRYWMNQTQNSESDRANYFRRAFGVDANMRHHLAMKMHVAFEQMRKERDAWKTMNDFRDKQERCNDWQSAYHEAVKERGALKAQVERLEKDAEFRYEQKQVFAEKNERLHQEINKLRAALEEIKKYTCETATNERARQALAQNEDE